MEPEGGAAASEWRVPQLITWAAPSGKHEVHWQEPGGTVHVFKADELLKREPDRVFSGWAAVADGGPGDYTFVSEQGWRYVYRGGAIVSLESPAGRKLNFETDRGRIVRVRQMGIARPLLEADYGRDGELRAVRVGPEEYTFRRSGGLLVEMRGSGVGSEPWRFQYSRRLLSGLRQPDGTIRRYEWTTDLAALRRESDLKLPHDAPKAILVGDDCYSYRYGVNREGLNLVRIDGLGRRDGIVFNPKTGEVLFRGVDGGERIVIWNGKRSPEGSAGRLREVRAPDGRILLAQQYDREGRLIARKQADRAVELFEYDERGRLSAIGRPGMRRWVFEYASGSSVGAGNDRPVKVTNALGDWMAFEYDACGQVTRYRDLDGHEHRFEYDALGRLVHHTLPTGHVRSVEYDEWGRVVAHTGADGHTTRIGYGANGKVAEVSDGSDVLSFAYDGAGRIVERLRNGEMDLRLEYATTAEGRVIEAVDRLGREFTAEFDADGNLVGRSRGQDWAVSYSYDDAGQLIGWTDARGLSVSFRRDEAGRISGYRNNLGQGYNFEWDVGGKLRLRENGEQSARYRYDRDGRLLEANYGNGEVVRYAYDDWGRLVRAETAEVTTEYAYDVMDRIVGVRETLPDGQRQTLAIQYTPGGRRASVSLMRDSANGMLASTGRSGPGGGRVLQVIDYRYDALGRAVSVAIDGEMRVHYSYDPTTLRLHSKRFNDGTGFVYQYDGRGRMVGQLAYDTSGQLIKGVSYEWDSHGRLIKRTLNAFDFSRQDGTLAAMSAIEHTDDRSVEQIYQYDADGRLASVTSPQRPDLNEHYRYDAAGNIVEKTTGNVTVRMTYDLANQLISVQSDEGLRTFEYDAAGRMVGEALNGERIATYTYGYLDKVVSVVRSSGSGEGNHGRRIDYFYNAGGLLVGKQPVGGRLEPWQWDPAMSLNGRVCPPALVARGNQLYVNEPHQVGGALLVSRMAGVGDDCHLLNDHLGSTLGAISTGPGISAASAGDVIRSNFLRTSFGDGPAAPSGAERFTGKPYDGDLGAFIFPYRNYRPDLGRWMSADPIHFPDGPNQHYYAPVATMAVDPWGLESGVSGEYSPDRTGIEPSLLHYIISPLGAVTSMIASKIIEVAWECTVKVTSDFNKSTGEWGSPTANIVGIESLSGDVAVRFSIGGIAADGVYKVELELIAGPISVESVTAASQDSPAEITYKVDMFLRKSTSIYGNVGGSGGGTSMTEVVDLNEDVFVTIYEN